MPSPKSTPQGEVGRRAVGIVGQAGEEASEAADRDAERQRRHELAARRTAYTGCALEELDATMPPATAPAIEWPICQNPAKLMLRLPNSSAPSDGADRQRDEVARIAQRRALRRAKYRRVRRIGRSPRPTSMPRRRRSDGPACAAKLLASARAAPEKFCLPACRSVHLRGGFRIGCGENVASNSLENPQSGVHSNQISQAGVEVSVMGCRKLTTQGVRGRQSRRARAGEE